MADDLREQTAKQCDVVVHMARQIAGVYEEMAKLIRGHDDETLVRITGPQSAKLMEELGDILNNMDAVLPEDEWVNPIFEKAHELWPTKEPANG